MVIETALLSPFRISRANLDHKQPTNSRHVYNIFMGHELKKFTLDSICVLTGINCSKRLIEIPGNTVDNSARGVSYIRYRAYYIANRSISIAQYSYAYITTSLKLDLSLSSFLRQYGTHDNPGISFPLHALYLEQRRTRIEHIEFSPSVSLLRISVSWI